MMYPWQAFALQPKFSHKIALRTAQGDIFNWAQVAEKVNQTVSFLRNKGVNPESAVAFIGKNTENILFLYLATIQLGAKILGINPAFPQEKIEELGIKLIKNDDVGIVDNNTIRHNADKVSELIYDYIIDDKPTMIYNKR